MRTFKQHITEVFEKPYKWKGGGLPKGRIKAKFDHAVEEYWFKTSDGGEIELMANHFWFEGGKKLASMKVKKEGHAIGIEFVKRDAQYKHPTYDMTGEGDALKILGTVLDIVKSIIKKHEPVTLYFSADKGGKEEGSRVGAYGAIVKRFAGKMGYKSDTKDSNRKVDWHLTKV